MVISTHRGCPGGPGPSWTTRRCHRDAGAGADVASAGPRCACGRVPRGDTELVALLGELDDPDTRVAVTAERTLLAELEAGCSAPVGAIAEVVESIDDDGRVFDELSLRACVAAADGSDVIRASGIGTPGRSAELGGLSVAAELFELGAREVMSVQGSVGTAEDGAERE